MLDDAADDCLSEDVFGQPPGCCSPLRSERSEKHWVSGNATSPAIYESPSRLFRVGKPVGRSSRGRATDALEDSLLHNFPKRSWMLGALLGPMETMIIPSITATSRYEWLSPTQSSSQKNGLETTIIPP